MVFASYTYILYLVATVSIYWLLPDKIRKCYLLIVSYIFYCFTGLKILVMLILYTILNYFLAKCIHKHRSKYLLTIIIILNILPLLYFKYTVFLLENISIILPVYYDIFKYQNSILPIGISFFTFQAVAYQIEVYEGYDKYQSLIDFSIYIAMWPKLLAGPIVRPEELYDQIYSRLKFDKKYFEEGYQRILQGLFKKIVVADNLAPIVNMVFLPNVESIGWMDCIFGTLAFGMQIYFDFSGYSDIAIGSARLIGYKFPENFDYPYKSVSFSDFWTKWHITLSKWIRDYIYYPMANKFRNNNTMIFATTIFSMIVMGFWHGANWTFVLWGLWHGLLICIQNTFGKSLFFRPKGIKRIIAITITFIAVHIGWLFFRADSLTHIVRMIKSIFMIEGGTKPLILQNENILLILLYFFGLNAWIIVMSYWKEHSNKYTYLNNNIYELKIIYNVVIIFTLVLMERNTQSFIYFKF